MQRFPLDTIKIDKSFVQEMMSSKKGYELIRTIILMARDLGMDTIAEGVENDEQLLELRSLMCKYGQGYLLSRPVDIQRIEDLLDQQRDQPENMGVFTLPSANLVQVDPE